MKLNKRLSCIANLINKYASYDDIFADIGTDHGYLPCFLVLNNILSYAYACDVAIGPLNSSKETISKNGLETKVIPLLGSGLEVVKQYHPTIACFAGMGGVLINELLENDLKDCDSIHTLILQANTSKDEVREYLMNHGFYIIDEEMVEDSNHIYEVIVAKKGQQQLTKEEIIFGPVLLKKRPLLMKKKWERELSVLNRFIGNLDTSSSRYKEVYEEMKRINHLLEGEFNED